MAAGAALVPNTPNFLGQLFQTDQMRTQFLSLAGGTDGANAEIATAIEFPISVNYAIGEGSQPAISETLAMGAAAPKHYVKTQNTNVVQIFQDDVAISEMRRRATGVLSGLAIAGQSPQESNEDGFQLNMALAKMKRDMNYTAVNGAFDKGGLLSSATANKTRGIIAAIVTNVVAKPLEPASITELVQLCYDKGTFNTPVLFANSTNRIAISQAYKAAELTQIDRDRLSGGVAVGKIVTEFGEVYLATDNNFPADTIVLADMSVVKPVFTLGRTGQAIEVKPIYLRGGEGYEVYAEFGLNHGDELSHAKLVITPAP